MRICSITKEEMSEGFVILGGEMYIKYEKDLVKHLRIIEKEDNANYDTDIAEGRLSDEWIKNDYYNADYYYWTHFED
jgi:hypothetical protein